MKAEETQGGGDAAPVGWGRAVATAAVMIVVSFIVFLYVPNRLLGYLSLHVVPRVRDLLVAGWWTVAFVACCWLFVRLQRSGKA